MSTKLLTRSRKLHGILGNPEFITFLAAVWLTVACNSAYWHVLIDASPDNAAAKLMFLLSFFLISVSLISATLLIFSSIFSTRATLTVTLPLAAAVGFFAASYGTLIDSGMLQNVLETNPAEALELFSPGLLTTVLLIGILPAAAIWRITFEERRLLDSIKKKFVALLVAVSLLVVPLSLQQKEIVSAVRNHHEIKHMISPLNVVSAAVTLTKHKLRKPLPFKSVGSDARLIRAASARTKPTVHVIIVGETARAANFSLAEYDRVTNPLLQARDDLYFAVARSCGTATTISVPCMFSAQDQAHFVSETANSQDNLLDIAARAGFDVHWFDNGNSCKGVCSRVDYRQLQERSGATDCDNGECFDDILIDELQGFLPTVTSDTLVILHQLGSHGPLYFRRYPPGFRTFQPDCQTANFGDCSVQEITNAYDNTIVYTDHIIDSAINTLSGYSDRFDVSLIYVSDHGESLGEHNLFLHGMPYRLAPAEQTHVPFIYWSGNNFARPGKNASQCRPIADGEEISHDNLFHTELGLLQIRTNVYRPEMDLFSNCISASGTAAT